MTSNNKEDLNLYQAEVQTGVSLTSFMTAVTSFFLGLLITRIADMNITIKIPILFLIISTFGFLFSSIIYSNASGEITRLNGNKAKNYMLIGNVLSEYFGVYLLVLSIPLVINAVTSDIFLRTATFIVVIISLSLYSISQFSIAHRYLKPITKNIFVLCIVILELVMFMAQINLLPYFTLLSTVFLIFIIISTYYFYKREERLELIN
ncbi:MAG: hypothetical protein WCW93_00645 [Candidatus Paceibacterota bacterium]